MKRIMKTKKLPKYIEKTKVEELIKRADDNPRDKIILTLLWTSGMRNSELVKLKKGDIKGNDIIIHQGKGNKDRVIPISDNVRTLLMMHSANLTLNDRLFPISTTRVRQILKKYEKEERIYPHLLRHSFAVHFLKSGGNLRSLQKILGHSNLNTTAIYLDLTGDDVRSDYEKLGF